jgi:prepilin-type N-terminal cleavage/methylation domain-containing protein
MNKAAMHGYTMIELIVVMVLLGTLGLLALPVFNSRTPVHELGMRDQLVAMLQYSRKLALVQHRGVCVLVTPTTVQALYAVGNACLAGNWVQEPGNANSAFTLPVPADVVMGGAALVQFDQDGKLTSNVALTITMGTRNVTVANETSLVTYF